jgi:hypothetical protein
MEYWKDGIMGREKTQKELTQYSNIPSFHFFRIPAVSEANS